MKEVKEAGEETKKACFQEEEEEEDTDYEEEEEDDDEEEEEDDDDEDENEEEEKEEELEEVQMEEVKETREATKKACFQEVKEVDDNDEEEEEEVEEVRMEEVKEAGGEAKKEHFQRLWSRDDEIILLKGMIDFKSGKGVSPYDDMNGFYDFVKKSISFDVSKAQFVEKIRNLKRKYLNKKYKGKNLKNPSSSETHDQKLFELSKNIWGPNRVASELPGGGKKDSLDMSGSDGIVRAMVAFGMDEFTVKQALARLTPANKKKLEAKWKALQLAEHDLLAVSCEFVQETTKAMAKTLRANR